MNTLQTLKDALNFVEIGDHNWEQTKQLKANLRTLIEAMGKSEPVAYLCANDKGSFDVLSDKACKKCFPVFTHPAQPVEQPTLTDESLLGLLGAALGALRYHTEQTRPIERTKETIRAIEHAIQGGAA